MRVEGLAWEKYSILALGIWLYSSKYRDMLGYIYHQCWGASNIKKYIQQHVNKQTREKFNCLRFNRRFPHYFVENKAQTYSYKRISNLRYNFMVVFPCIYFCEKLLAFSLKSSTIHRISVILHCQYHDCNSTYNCNCIK